MKRALTSMALATLFASICLLASTTTVAQSERAPQSPPEKKATSPESVTCFSAYSSGSGATKFAFCITAHGNIIHLEAPDTIEHIKTNEGYVVCDAFANSKAYDAGPAESGWDDSVISQPGGLNTFPLTITRNSSDGKFQLKQSFAQDSAKQDITITMTVKNISGQDIAQVILARYFDGDIDGNSADSYNYDLDSVWGTQPKSQSLGLTALTLTTEHTAIIEKYLKWVASRSTCTTAGVLDGTPQTDYIGRLTYNLGLMKAGASKTVKMDYRRF